MERLRGKNGLFLASTRKYAPLLRYDSVQLYANSYAKTRRAEHLWALNEFFEQAGMSLEEFVELNPREKKHVIRSVVLNKQAEEKFSSGRRLFYAVRRFLELNGDGIEFSKTERKILLRSEVKKVGFQHIPSRDEVYRMVDSANWRSQPQSARAKALVLCGWQSGVRPRCLTSWKYGIFAKTLFPQPEIPLKIKVLAKRPNFIHDCALDTKLRKQGIAYYFTFLHEESAYALKRYLQVRMENGWNPKPSDHVFVTERSVSQEKALDTRRILSVVKGLAKNVGIQPGTFWTHLLRKAFRKTLYKGGCDPDIAEALMGHSLGGSRGNYFDYADMKLVRKAYLSCPWQRIDAERIESIEDEVGELRRQLRSVVEECEELEDEIYTLKYERGKEP